MGLMGQTNFAYPEHYKTIDDDSIQVGDTIVMEIRLDFCTRWPNVLDTLNANRSQVNFFKRNDQLIYDIHTNTDARGSAESNLKLSHRRAKEIKQELLKFGVDSSVFRGTYGHGESQPIISMNEIINIESKAEQEMAYQLNRRTYFVVVGKNE